MAAQIIYLVLSAMGLGIALAEHGKPREPHDFWTALIASGIGYSLLIWGGFFAPLGW